jgi:hypothetical protein
MALSGSRRERSARSRQVMFTPRAARWWLGCASRPPRRSRASPAAVARNRQGSLPSAPPVYRAARPSWIIRPPTPLRRALAAFRIATPHCEGRRGNGRGRGAERGARAGSLTRFYFIRQGPARQNGVKTTLVPSGRGPPRRACERGHPDGNKKLQQ